MLSKSYDHIHPSRKGCSDINALFPHTIAKEDWCHQRLPVKLGSKPYSCRPCCYDCQLLIPIDTLILTNPVQDEDDIPDADSLSASELHYSNGIFEDLVYCQLRFG
jgi:hypothetical protein